MIRPDDGSYEVSTAPVIAAAPCDIRPGDTLTIRYDRSLGVARVVQVRRKGQRVWPETDGGQATVVTEAPVMPPPRAGTKRWLRWLRS